MTKTTKEEINGSTLYFFKKVQVIWGLFFQLVTVIAIVLSTYYILRRDVEANKEALRLNTETLKTHTARLDKKHDEIMMLQFAIESQQKALDRLDRLEKNLEKYMQYQGYKYNKELK